LRNAYRRYRNLEKAYRCARQSLGEGEG
jgi:hypothetical protein